MNVKAPFPYFGGKSKVAGLVWARFGDVANYVEPFAGSLAMLLGRPEPQGIETINDKCGYIANFWRAMQHDPEAVAFHADNPVNENDLHARHAWLVENTGDLDRRLEGDPDHFDAKIAGWWVWGACCWIGAGWCSGEGPWVSRVGTDGVARLEKEGDAGRGVNRQLPHLGNAGQGVNRKRDQLITYFETIRDRIRDVRVCCGDWSRICGDTPLFPTSRNQSGPPTAVFLDPPYSAEADRHNTIYNKEDLSVAHIVREWAIERGSNPRLRIALCGYENEHAMPPDWECVAWSPGHGYGSQRKTGYANAGRERIWFSPACVRLAKAKQTLFAMENIA